MRHLLVYASCNCHANISFLYFLICLRYQVISTTLQLVPTSCDRPTYLIAHLWEQRASSGGSSCWATQSSWEVGGVDEGLVCQTWNPQNHGNHHQFLPGFILIIFVYKNYRSVPLLFCCYIHLSGNKCLRIVYRTMLRKFLPPNKLLFMKNENAFLL